MQADDNFEYRYTVIFPEANAYSVDDILNFISAVEHHLDSDKWDDDARNEFKLDLIERLLGAVIDKKFELWNSYLNKVVPPPIQSSRSSPKGLSDSSEPSPIKRFWKFLIKSFSRPIEPVLLQASENPTSIPHGHQSRQSYKNDFWWARLTFIYKSDLIKFCQGQKIRATFKKTSEPAPASEMPIAQNENSTGAKINNTLAAPSPTQGLPVDIPVAQNPPPADSSNHELPSGRESMIAGDTPLQNRITGSMHPSFLNFKNLPDDAYVPMEVVCALFGCSESTVVRRTKKGILKKHSKGVRDARWNVGELREVLKNDTSQST